MNLELKPVRSGGSGREKNRREMEGYVGSEREVGVYIGYTQLGFCG